MNNNNSNNNNAKSKEFESLHTQPHSLFSTENSTSLKTVTNRQISKYSASKKQRDAFYAQLHNSVNNNKTITQESSAISILGQTINREYSSQFCLPNQTLIAVRRLEYVNHLIKDLRIFVSVCLPETLLTTDLRQIISDYTESHSLAKQFLTYDSLINAEFINGYIAFDSNPKDCIFSNSPDDSKSSEFNNCINNNLESVFNETIVSSEVANLVKYYPPINYSQLNSLQYNTEMITEPQKQMIFSNDVTISDDNAGSSKIIKSHSRHDYNNSLSTKSSAQSQFSSLAKSDVQNNTNNARHGEYKTDDKTTAENNYTDNLYASVDVDSEVRKHKRKLPRPPVNEVPEMEYTETSRDTTQHHSHKHLEFKERSNTLNDNSATSKSSRQPLHKQMSESNTYDVNVKITSDSLANGSSKSKKSDNTVSPNPYSTSNKNTKDISGKLMFINIDDDNQSNEDINLCTDKFKQFSTTNKANKSDLKLLHSHNNISVQKSKAIDINDNNRNTQINIPQNNTHHNFNNLQTRKNGLESTLSPDIVINLNTNNPPQSHKVVNKKDNNILPNNTTNAVTCFQQLKSLQMDTLDLNSIDRSLDHIYLSDVPFADVETDSDYGEEMICDDDDVMTKKNNSIGITKCCDNVALADNKDMLEVHKAAVLANNNKKANKDNVLQVINSDYLPPETQKSNNQGYQNPIFNISKHNNQNEIFVSPLSLQHQTSNSSDDVSEENEDSSDDSENSDSESSAEFNISVEEETDDENNFRLKVLRSGGGSGISTKLPTQHNIPASVRARSRSPHWLSMNAINEETEPEVNKQDSNTNSPRRESKRNTVSLSLPRNVDVAELDNFLAVNTPQATTDLKYTDSNHENQSKTKDENAKVKRIPSKIQKAPRHQITLDNNKNKNQQSNTDATNSTAMEAENNTANVSLGPVKKIKPPVKPKPPKVIDNTTTETTNKSHSASNTIPKESLTFSQLVTKSLPIINAIRVAPKVTITFNEDDPDDDSFPQEFDRMSDLPSPPPEFELKSDSTSEENNLGEEYMVDKHKIYQQKSNSINNNALQNTSLLTSQSNYQDISKATQHDNVPSKVKPHKQQTTPEKQTKIKDVVLSSQNDTLNVITAINTIDLNSAIKTPNEKQKETHHKKIKPSVAQSEIDNTSNNINRKMLLTEANSQPEISPRINADLIVDNKTLSKTPSKRLKKNNKTEDIIITSNFIHDDINQHKDNKKSEPKIDEFQNNSLNKHPESNDRRYDQNLIKIQDKEMIKDNDVVRKAKHQHCEEHYAQNEESVQPRKSHGKSKQINNNTYDEINLKDDAVINKNKYLSFDKLDNKITNTNKQKPGNVVTPGAVGEPSDINNDDFITASCETDLDSVIQKLHSSRINNNNSNSEKKIVKQNDKQNINTSFQKTTNKPVKPDDRNVNTNYENKDQILLNDSQKCSSRNKEIPNQAKSDKHILSATLSQTSKPIIMPNIPVPSSAIATDLDMLLSGAIKINPIILETESAQILSQKQKVHSSAKKTLNKDDVKINDYQFNTKKEILPDKSDQIEEQNVKSNISDETSLRIKPVKPQKLAPINTDIDSLYASTINQKNKTATQENPNLSKVSTDRKENTSKIKTQNKPIDMEKQNTKLESDIPDLDTVKKYNENESKTRSRHQNKAKDALDNINNKSDIENNNIAEILADNDKEFNVDENSSQNRNKKEPSLDTKKTAKFPTTRNEDSAMLDNNGKLLTDIKQNITSIKPSVLMNNIQIQNNADLEKLKRLNNCEEEDDEEKEETNSDIDKDYELYAQEIRKNHNYPGNYTNDITDYVKAEEKYPASIEIDSKIEHDNDIFKTNRDDSKNQQFIKSKPNLERISKVTNNEENAKDNKNNAKQKQSTDNHSITQHKQQEQKDIIISPTSPKSIDDATLNAMTTISAPSKSRQIHLGQKNSNISIGQEPQEKSPHNNIESAMSKRQTGNKAEIPLEADKLKSPINKTKNIQKIVEIEDNKKESTDINLNASKQKNEPSPKSVNLTSTSAGLNSVDPKKIKNDAHISSNFSPVISDKTMKGTQQQDPQNINESYSKMIRNNTTDASVIPSVQAKGTNNAPSEESRINLRYKVRSKSVEHISAEISHKTNKTVENINSDRKQNVNQLPCPRDSQSALEYYDKEKHISESKTSGMTSLKPGDHLVSSWLNGQHTTPRFTTLPNDQNEQFEYEADNIDQSDDEENYNRGKTKDKQQKRKQSDSNDKFATNSAEKIWRKLQSTIKHIKKDKTNEDDFEACVPTEHIQKIEDTSSKFHRDKDEEKPTLLKNLSQLIRRKSTDISQTKMETLKTTAPLEIVLPRKKEFDNRERREIKQKITDKITKLRESKIEVNNDKAEKEEKDIVHKEKKHHKHRLKLKKQKQGGENEENISNDHPSATGSINNEDDDDEIGKKLFLAKERKDRNENQIKQRYTKYSDESYTDDQSYDSDSSYTSENSSYISSSYTSESYTENNDNNSDVDRKIKNTTSQDYLEPIKRRDNVENNNFDSGSIRRPVTSNNSNSIRRVSTNSGVKKVTDDTNRIISQNSNKDSEQELSEDDDRSESCVASDTHKLKINLLYKAKHKNAGKSDSDDNTTTSEDDDDEPEIPKIGLDRISKPVNNILNQNIEIITQNNVDSNDGPISCIQNVTDEFVAHGAETENEHRINDDVTENFIKSYNESMYNSVSQLSDYPTNHTLTHQVSFSDYSQYPKETVKTEPTCPKCENGEAHTCIRRVLQPQTMQRTKGNKIVMSRPHYVNLRIPVPARQVPKISTLTNSADVEATSQNAFGTDNSKSNNKTPSLVSNETDFSPKKMNQVEETSINSTSIHERNDNCSLSSDTSEDL